jgi:hypothetical protein
MTAPVPFEFIPIIGFAASIEVGLFFILFFPHLLQGYP